MGDDDRRRPPGTDGPQDVPRQVPRPVPTPWGDVIIPDDISELADEAAQVRRELRRQERRRTWGRLVGISADRRQPGIVGPVLIVVLAISVTLASLVGSFWPYRAASEGSGKTPAGVGRTFPSLALPDTTGATVKLHTIRPAVILAVSQCDCSRLIADSATLAKQADVPLVVVREPAAKALPATVEGDDPDAVRSLGDPHGALIKAVATDRPTENGTAVVVLVAADGTMHQVLPEVQSVEEFRAGVRHLQ